MWRWTIVLLFILSVGSAGYCTDYDQVLKDARALARAGNKQAAANLLQTAAGSATDHGAEWLRAYLLIWRDAPKRDAITQFLKVADRFPESKYAPDALLHVGYLRDENGDDARPDWERLVRQHPGTKEAAEALHCLGHRALRDRDPELAIKRFKEAAAVQEANPDSVAESLVEAGYACISQYWKTKHQEFLTQALEVFRPLTSESGPRQWNVRARLGRGEIYLIQGDGRRALDEYQAALDAKPADPYLLGLAEYEVSCALYTKRDWAGAESALATFLDNRSGQTLLEKNSQWKQARPGYAKLSAVDPSKAAGLSGLDLVPSAAYWRASALFNLKRYREAKTLVNEVQTGFPSIAMAKKVEELSNLCDYVLGEGK